MKTPTKNDSPVPSFSGTLDDAAAAAWREEFPLLKTVNYMANCSQGPQSRRARAALDRYLESWVASGMDWDYWCQEVDLAKVEFARLIGADPDEIAVSTSVSEIIASVAGAFLPQGGRRKVVTTEAEFPTVGQVWLAHRKLGAEVDFVPVIDGETLWRNTSATSTGRPYWPPSPMSTTRMASSRIWAPSRKSATAMTCRF